MGDRRGTRPDRRRSDDRRKVRTENSPIRRSKYRGRRSTDLTSYATLPWAKPTLKERVLALPVTPSPTTPNNVSRAAVLDLLREFGVEDDL